VLLGCRDGDGSLFIVDEHAERMWLPQRHAPAIVAILGRHSISNRRLEISDLRRFVAGADVFSIFFRGMDMTKKPTNAEDAATSRAPG